MSWRTSFLKSEYNTWKWRIRTGVSRSWSRITFAFAMQPLKYRVREFFRRYFFVGVIARYRREKRAVANANAFQARIRERQLRCSHLKGRRFLNMTGAPRPSTLIDYNVSFHRFVNNRARVICNICKRVWWEGDADWKQALDMVKNSTNSPSSSEIPAAVLRGEYPWRDQHTKSSFWTRTLKLLKKSFRLGRTGASKS